MGSATAPFTDCTTCTTAALPTPYGTHPHCSTPHPQLPGQSHHIRCTPQESCDPCFPAFASERHRCTSAPPHLIVGEGIRGAVVSTFTRVHLYDTCLGPSDAKGMGVAARETQACMQTTGWHVLLGLCGSTDCALLCALCRCCLTLSAASQLPVQQACQHSTTGHIIQYMLDRRRKQRCSESCRCLYNCCWSAAQFLASILMQVLKHARVGVQMRDQDFYVS
jgi:hypothetical protein